MKQFLLSLIFICVVVAATPAAELGQPAAPLQISEWVKGKPVDLAAAKGKQVVVVEFWTPRDPAGRENILRLNEIQKKFKDVLCIGITGEEPDLVKKFVTQMGDKMDYAVAIDDKEQNTGAGYLKAYGISAVPHAFVVDKEGRVAWHGHPLAGLEKVLTEVIAGRFDLEKATKRDKAQQKLAAFYQAVSAGAPEATLDAMGKELETLDAEIGGFYPNQKFDPTETRKMVKFQELLQQYQQVLDTTKEAPVLAALEKQLEANAPKNFNLADIKESFAIRPVVMNYFLAATGRRDANKLPQYTQELLDLKIRNAEALNQIAWTILTDENIKQRDLVLATKLAKAGVEASEGKMAAVLDTYARALFDSGKVAEAITQQKRAIAVADSHQEDLEQTLKKYQEKAAAKPATGN